MRKRLLAAMAAIAVAGIAPAPHSTLAGPAASGHGASGSGASATAVVPPTETEARFDAGLSPDSLRAWMKHLTAKPHHTGSPGSKEAAEYIAGLMRSWGLETEIERFDVLFPTPKSRSLELLSPGNYTAILSEPAVEGDATSGLEGQLPIYNAYSADGDVTGELVYVNYGLPSDYEELDRRGISVAGKIVISRYGGGWRGIKPKVAAEHGAIGCIIFSDPGSDGYAAGDVYPKGGWRNQFGAQRGSVADMPIHSGDPLTPGVGATRDAKRLALKDAETLTKIPTLPISYHDAEPLLRAIGGPVAPDGWKGGLPLTYHIGPGPATVRLAVAFNWDQAPVYDVIGKIKGGERPDEWIIRGNHHDAWVFGATDPVSGLVALMAEARSFGEMAKTGWKPKRTLVYCAWDGEEQGLLGSTEWVETHAAELRQKAAVYINTDASGRGFLGAGGSHTLEKFFDNVPAGVADPYYGVSLNARVRANEIVGASSDERGRLRSGGAIKLDPLGSGSDFTPFLQHLGIASLNLGFGGEDHYGQYHSSYDSYDHYVRFSDTSFAYGVALAKTCGRAVLRLADAPVLPFDFDALASTVAGYAREVEELAGRMRDDAEELNRKLDEKSLVWAADPHERYVPPPRAAEVPFFNFAPLKNAVELLKARASSYSAAIERAGGDGSGLSAEKRKALDAVLIGMERRLTSAKGLEGRPWFIHQVYAPGRYTGYGVKTLPAVREAIELRRYSKVDAEIAALARVLEGYCAGIDEALAILQ